MLLTVAKGVKRLGTGAMASEKQTALISYKASGLMRRYRWTILVFAGFGKETVLPPHRIRWVCPSLSFMVMKACTGLLACDR